MNVLANFCCAGLCLATWVFITNPAYSMPLTDEGSADTPKHIALSTPTLPVASEIPEPAMLPELQQMMATHSPCLEPETYQSYHWLCGETQQTQQEHLMAVTDDSPSYHLQIQRSRFIPYDSNIFTLGNSMLRTDTRRQSWAKKLRALLAGKPAKNGIYLGLWSRHFGTDTDYHNVGNLVALQHNGWFYGTFANSHAQQTFAVGLARTLFYKQLTRSVAVHGGYKFGPMYGYRYDGVPNLAGFTVMPLTTIGFDFKRLGVDFNMPVGTNSLSMNFRFNGSPFRNRKKD